jgi:hypothetical protein
MGTNKLFVAAALVAGELVVSQHALAADKWFLLARHGECFPIRSMERKLPDLGNIADPEAFVKFIRAKGLKVDSKVMPVQTGRAVEVRVPEKELALVFVTADVCSSIQSR